MALFIVGLGITDPKQPDALNQEFGFLIVGILAILLVVGFICVAVTIGIDLAAECKKLKNKDDKEHKKLEEEFKYKKWKKRRQLIKREIVQKEKQKLLDQHEDLVNKYRRQLEEEEERRAREEEERERLENGEEEGNDMSRGWQDDPSGYMMQGYGGYNDPYVLQQMQQQQKQFGMFAEQQQKMGGFASGVNNRMPEGRGNTP